MSRFPLNLVLALIAASLAACSTPQIALDQANNGVHLAQRLQEQLAEYKADSQRSAKRRLTSIKQTEDGIAEQRLRLNFITHLDAKTGKTEQLNARELIRETSDFYNDQLDAKKNASLELQNRLDESVKDLPTPGENLNALQKALAELGTELSARERADIFLRIQQGVLDEFNKDSKIKAESPDAGASTIVPATSAVSGT